VFSIVGVSSCDGSEAQAEPAEAAAPADPKPVVSAPEAPAQNPESGAPTALWEPESDDTVEAKQPFDDPTGHALDRFYARLAEVDEGGPGALARVTHLGDSSIGYDGLTHAIRSRMQERFGDGGPGFLLLSRYSGNYRPRAVEFRADGWSDCYIGKRCAKDGHYGLGGVSSSSRGRGSTFVGPPKKFPNSGYQVSQLELWYAAMPKGGGLEIRVNGEAKERIATEAPELEDRWFEMSLAPGPHEVTVRATGVAKSRAYGLVLESAGPGVVWDSLSMIGAFTRRLRQWDHNHITRQLERRKPDLLVLTYGGNDLRRVSTGGLARDQYYAEYDEVLRNLKSDHPDLPCLITSVIDHGASGTFQVRTAHVEMVVEVQKDIAAAHSCAFFNTYEAMGGAGSIYQWLNQKPRLAEPDLKHLNYRGRDLMGENIYRAIMNGYVAYRRRVTRLDR
jgi:lysophospholipase L1-like esterase